MKMGSLIVNYRKRTLGVGKRLQKGFYWQTFLEIYLSSSESNDQPESYKEDVLLHRQGQLQNSVQGLHLPPCRILCSSMVSVPRIATKLVTSLRKEPYLVQLQELKLYPLEITRLGGDLTEVFKIMNSLVEMKSQDLFLMSHNTATRGHRFKIFKKWRKGWTLRNTSFRKGWLMYGISFLIMLLM